MKTEQELPKGFGDPTDLPTDREREEWQQLNRSWWERNPMRYDWREEIGRENFSRPYFEEIDRRFFGDAARYAPPRVRPFDALIPFDEMPKLDVLEIGVGSGSHAQLLAPHCRTYTGIDLTDFAVGSTRKRFELFGLKGDLRRMDAEALDFPDGSFDYIWTWGVIHHSANTEKILGEMQRVLRPGGRATVMVYHHSPFYFYVFNGFFRGVLGGGFAKTRSLHRLVQMSTDGALARYYRPGEWRRLVESRGFSVEAECIKGQKSELFPLPAGRFKDALMAATPDALSRLVLNNWKQGTFLITTLRKI